MRTFKFLDVGFTYRALQPALDQAWADVNESGYYIGGPAVSDFEAAFARYCGVRHCVGTGNGLDALVLILRGMGIGPGAEVIVPAHTFIATWLAVSQAGARPVPVDADPVTMNMNLDLVETAITPRTRAIMPVHLYGAPVAFAGLRALAAAHDLQLIEDAAQAVGASDHGARVGSLGHAAGFSFYPGKNLGAFGDAGAVVTNDGALADRVRQLGNYGMARKYVHETAGVNSRLDTLQARVLSAKLAVLDEWQARRAAIAALYAERLSQCAELVLPQTAPDLVSSWHLYVVRHARRDQLMEALRDRGVETMMHYPVANHLSGAYRDAFEGRSFPVTEQICRTCLSLPIGPHLTIEDAGAIAEIVADTVPLI